MAPLVKYAGERDTGEPEASSNESPRREPKGIRVVFRHRGILSAYASGFRWGGFGLPVSREPAYVTSAGMDAGAQAHPSE